MKVWLLQHEQSTDDGDDVKILGVYASAQDAEAAQRRLGALQGFRDDREGFSIDPYEVGQDHWTEGFVPTTDAGETSPLPRLRRASA